MCIFDKYVALVRKFQNNPQLEVTEWHLGYLKNVILPLYIQQGGSEEVFLHKISQWYELDLRVCLGETDVLNELEADIKRIRGDKKRKWFLLTVNFDDKTITIPGIKDAHSKIKEIKDIQFLAHSIEKHRRNDLGKIIHHHHIHYVIQTNYPKSKVIQFVHQKLKKYITRNYVDVSCNGTIDTALKYVSGDKQDSKKELVQLDKEWRKKNSLDNI